MVLTKISGTVGPSSPIASKSTEPDRARLLYVEDNDANWEVAQLLLKGSYQLTRARDAKEAVSHLENSGFDLILMDIELGGSDLDGIQLTQLFRGSLANPPPFAAQLRPVDTPIVFVTAYTARYGDHELQSKGGDGVVHKPVDPDELTGAIWKMLNAHRMATIDAQQKQLEAEREARQIQDKALLEIQAAHEKLQAELTARRKVEGELASMEDELKQAGARLKEAQKLATYGELLASIAHEINTPISTGATGTELLIEDVNNVEEAILSLFGEEEDGQKARALFKGKFDDVREKAELLTLSYDRLKGISEALRMGSRRSSEFLLGFNINQVIEQSMVLARGRLRVYDVRLELGDIPEISCQPNYLGQVIINMMTNAADAIDQHCKDNDLSAGQQVLRIATERSNRDGRVGVCLISEDSGPGVPESIREKIFQSFFTTKGHGVGTGLGLAISIKIVTDHQGTIEVSQSESFGGARFEIWLPATQLPID